LRKVVALKQKRLVLRNCGCKREAIAEVQAGRMAAFPKVAICVSCVVGFASSEGFDADFEGDEEVVEVR